MELSNTFIVALLISAALLVVPVLLRFNRKSVAAASAESFPRREPSQSHTAINTPKSLSDAVSRAAMAQVRVAHGKQTPLDSFISCLDEALETHYRDWVEPLVAAADGTTFILQSVTVEITAANLPLLESASNLKPALLKRVFEDRVAKSAGHAHYDKAKFYGIAFRNGTEAKPSDGDVIRVLKAHGGERIEITLIFHGEPDYRAPRATQFREATNGSLDLAAGGQRSAIATLEVTLPGAVTRTVAIRHTPFRIGADPAADLQIDSPFLSANHAVLDASADGNFTLTDKSRNGTWLNGTRLGAATPVRLGARGLILLSNAVPGADVPLIEFRSNSVAPLVSEIPRGAAEKMDSADPNVTVTQTQALARGAAVSPQRAVSSDITSAEKVVTVAPTKAVAVPVKQKARLRTIMSDGTEATYLLTELGCEIGREPGENDIAARPTAIHISRRHLRLVDWAHESGIFVENLAVTRGGTYLDGQRQDAVFIWRFADPKRPAEGWLTLGEARMSNGGMRLRLERIGA